MSFEVNKLQIESHNPIHSDLEPAETAQYNLNLERLSGTEAEQIQIIHWVI